MTECSGGGVEPYFEALRRGRLQAQRCQSCSRLQLYPRSVCRHCHGRSLQWLELSGRGEISAYTAVYRAIDPERARNVPYVIALIDLDEGVRLLGNIEADPAAVQIGAPVVLLAADERAMPAPRFALA